MIRVLIIIFISMSLKANLLERDDVKKFIDLAVEESNLTREEIIDYIKDAQPSPKAVELRSNQPEVKATWDDYRSKRVTDTRILNGVNFINENADIFNKVEKDYGVSKFYIASIIGLETNYGGYLGSFNPLDTIFTRAFDPDSRFWQRELIELLVLSKRYGLNPKEIKSSWSGAIGLGQFIPSSYNAYGVDYDYDGYVDLLNSRMDGIASVANFLKVHGWNSNQPAAAQVALSEQYSNLNDEQIDELEFPFKINNFRTKVSPDTLNEAGFSVTTNQDDDLTPLLFFEEGATKLFIGFDNFRVITKYNRSSKYALSVHQLAVAIPEKFYE